MRIFSSFIRTTFALAAFSAPLGVTHATLAAQSDIDLLNSYIGSWRGDGTATVKGKDEKILCTLSVTSAGTEKVNYNGKCGFSGGSLNIRGTILFNESVGVYEAGMSTNAKFSGTAIGKRSDKGIDFILKNEAEDKDAEKAPNETITVGIALVDKAIDVDLSVKYADSGDMTTAKVSLAKKQ